ncbi:polysaccharide deacetylase family protein [Elioraea rosea]|uniref:polysaccharide deacetylase family protein n=1 Tax=Elioraea rosea TaxID=2492390 RepID=UPI001185782C|nr:polysaccharide deacetylase family protein [Elioraea rosea]
MSAGLPFELAPTRGFDRPLLGVVLDTEEEFDWSAPFSRRNRGVNGLAHLHKGHKIFRRYGLTPAYLVDHPIVADPRAAEVFGPWLAAGECLVGAQLHPWVTPPYEEVVCPYNSFPCNLEPDLERRKLATLTEAITTTLGVAPRIYKAGRYGLDIRREEMLLALGYTVDTSVMPFRDFSGLGGGPNFFGFPDQPFWLGPDRVGAERRVLYLPVSQSLVGPLRFVRESGAGRRIFGPLSSRLRLPGLLARLHLLERIMLTPEGVAFEEMRRLVDAQVADGRMVFTLSMHSPSFMLGGTPYTRSPADLDTLLATIDRFLDYFFHELGGIATDPLSLRAQLIAVRV